MSKPDDYFFFYDWARRHALRIAGVKMQTLVGDLPINGCSDDFGNWFLPTCTGVQVEEFGGCFYGRA